MPILFTSSCPYHLWLKRFLNFDDVFSLVQFINYIHRRSDSPLKWKQKPHNHSLSSAHTAKFWSLILMARYQNTLVYLLPSSIPRLMSIHPPPPSCMFCSGKHVATQWVLLWNDDLEKCEECHSIVNSLCVLNTVILLSTTFHTSK